MASILVVDDEVDLETLIKQKFRREIREGRYDFCFAHDGQEALDEIARRRTIDIVLCDLNMPVMDGLTLLARLHESAPLIKSVVVSAYGDMGNIRTAMNRGAFDFVTKPINFEDLQLTVAKTLTYAAQIRTTLQAIKENDILRMYVDDNVLNFMGSREFEPLVMANETIEASVAFIDICGFTKISETAPPDQVVALINLYFDTMVQEITRHGGYVDKFIGDAVMAVFKDDFHLDRAIDAALAICAGIDRLPSDGPDESFKPAVSVGIKSGEMICGNIGSASLKRLDYTVIGDTVNVAARLQDAAGPNQIYISEGCYGKVRESFDCRLVGTIALKNKRTPITVYEVVE